MIKIERLTHELEGRSLFEELSLEVKKGEKILLSANSGTGKTTLLKLLMGFQRADKGEIFVDDIELNTKNIEEVRGKISYISQGVELPNIKVEELLIRVFSYRKNSRLKGKKEFHEYLDYFALNQGIMREKVANLSGGERQRVAFIINILLDREIWLLDEPTASLDMEMKAKVEEFILNTNKTVVLVSHDKHWNNEAFREVKW